MDFDWDLVVEFRLFFFLLGDLYGAVKKLIHPVPVPSLWNSAKRLAPKED